MQQKEPTSWEEVVAFLALLGVSIATAKLLFQKKSFTWRELGASALERALLAAAGTIPLFFYPTAHPVPVVALGAGLAYLGVEGIRQMFAAWRGKKS